jgi:hypothetical protein
LDEDDDVVMNGNRTGDLINTLLIANETVAYATYGYIL